jgi:hypothetical protein
MQNFKTQESVQHHCRWYQKREVLSQGIIANTGSIEHQTVMISDIIHVPIIIWRDRSLFLLAAHNDAINVMNDFLLLF